jgi:hypothetical protein
MEGMNQYRKFAGLSLIIGWLLLLGGCYGPSALDRDYGRAVHNNIAQSVVNPAAGLDPLPAVGQIPKAADNTLDRYERTFKGEEKISPYQGITTGGKM